MREASITATLHSTTSASWNLKVCYCVGSCLHGHQIARSTSIVSNCGILVLILILLSLFILLLILPYWLVCEFELSCVRLRASTVAAKQSGFALADRGVVTGPRQDTILQWIVVAILQYYNIIITILQYYNIAIL